MTEQDLNRFMTFVDKQQKEPFCWLWTGAVTRRYPDFHLCGRTVKAHHAIYIHYNGDIPNGLNVLHTCDNPICVNPGHVFAGTQKQNIQDAARKGKWSTLTAEQVVEIRSRSKSGQRNRELAGLYGVSKGTISNIITGRRWSV